MPAATMTTRDYSLIVGTTAVSVFPPSAISNGLFYMRLWNVAPSSGGTIWLSRSGTAVVNGPGSYPLLPGLYELFTVPQAIPLNALSVIATAAGTPLTVEVG